MRRKIIPGVIDGQQVLANFTLEDSVLAAAEMMAERNIGAVMIVDEGILQGIVTERDLATKVIAKRRDPEQTKLRAIMTPKPETVDPDESVLDAIQRMHEGRFRHLPVVDHEGVLHGIVSLRDMYRVAAEVAAEQLRQTETMIYGESYGVAG